MERGLDRMTQASAALVVLATGAWVITIRAPDSMELGPAPFLGSWTAMMAAMMLPSAAPLLLLYRRSTSGVPTALLATGYLLVWAALGLLAYAYVRSELMAPAAAIFAAAGLYQLTPLKTACLARCRSPVDFLVTRYGRGPLRLGVEHGLWCAGCCWALMIVLVAAGSMGLGWAVAIALLVFVEKIAPYGDVLARATGLGLLALAVTEGVWGWPGI